MGYSIPSSLQVAEELLFKAPATVDFNVNGACNLDCAWCWGPDHEAHEGLTIEAWKEIAYRLHCHGTKKITFTGGEPLMKKGLGECLRYIHDELAIVTTLSTNGLLLKPKARDILPSVDDIGLPLDGHVKEINNLMRAGTPRHFDKVLEAIKFVQDEFPRISLTVRTVVSLKNYESVPLIGKTMQDFGIDPERLRWKLYQVTPIGVRKGDVLEGEWLISNSQFEEAMHKVRTLNPQFPDITTLTSDMHVGRYFHIYPDGKTHLFITGEDRFPVALPLGNIGSDFDGVLKKMNDFDLTNNDIR